MASIYRALVYVRYSPRLCILLTELRFEYFLGFVIKTAVSFIFTDGKISQCLQYGTFLHFLAMNGNQDSSHGTQ